MIIITWRLIVLCVRENSFYGKPRGSANNSRIREVYSQGYIIKHSPRQRGQHLYSLITIPSCMERLALSSIKPINLPVFSI